MSGRTVRFYLAFNSPFVFLASTRIERALEPTGALLEHVPLYSPRPDGPPDFTTPRFRYLLEDSARFAESYGLELKPGPFADTKKACLGLLFAADHGRAAEYRRGVCNARWLEGRDIGDEAVLGAIARAAGLPSEGFRAALGEPALEARLAECNRAAEKDGVFGVPTFVIDGKRFWGNDRIEWLVRELNRA